MSETEYGGIRPYGALLALLVIIYKVALQQLAFGSQHIQSVHGIRSIEV